MNTAGAEGSIRSRMGLNLDVACDRYTRHRNQIEVSSRSLHIPDRCEEHPLAQALAAKVPSPFPLCRFLGVPTTDPGDQRQKYLAVHIGKGLL